MSQEKPPQSQPEAAPSGQPDVSHTHTDESLHMEANREDKPKEAIALNFESRYIQGALLREGATGQVFRVRKVSDGPVALACKVVEGCVRPLYTDFKAMKAWEQGVKAIANKLRIWENFESPFLVPLEESVREGENKIYLVMPEATHGALTGYPLKKLSDDDILLFIVEIMDGIIHMHDKGIVHRDLKPDNILMTVNLEDGEVKAMVADFGHSREGSTLEGRVGTKGWMAPKVELGKKYNNKVDAYGVGLIAWWMWVMSTHILLGGNTNPSAFSTQVRSFLKALLAQSPSERSTVKEARLHPLVRDICFEHGLTPEELAVLSSGNGVTLPVLPALPVNVPPVTQAHVPAELNEKVVSAMLVLENSSTSSIPELLRAPSLPLPAGLTLWKRERGVSMSNETPGAKRRKRRQETTSGNDRRDSRDI
ncbi:hypothetical protein FRB95_004262 [Tulasnella sp. JGI-2019a]|nr:hypothetical protein FRB95_004262 [Tulasnella sp. JGI-2019a]